MRRLSDVRHDELRGVPSTTPTAGPARAPWWLVGAAASAIVLARLAVGPRGAFDRVWSEDAVVFLGDAQHHGWHSLFYSYAGYGAVFARLWGLLAAALPLSAVPLFSVLVAALMTGLLAGGVYAVSRHVTGSPRVAYVSALFLVACPTLRHETLGNIANLQWFMIPLLVWLYLMPIATAGARRGIAVLVFLLVVSCPPTAVLMASLLLLHGRRFYRHPAAIPTLAGAAVQGLYITVLPKTGIYIGRAYQISPSDAKATLGALADSPAPAAASHALAGLVLLATVLIILAARQRAALALAAGGSVIFLLMSFVDGFPQARYVALWLTLLVFSAVMTTRANELLRRSLRPWYAVLAIYCAVGFPISQHRVDGPSWSSELARNAAQCKAHHEATFVVTPTSFFTADLNC